MENFFETQNFLKIFFKIDRDLVQSLQRELKVLKNMFFLLFGTLGRYLVGSKNWGAIPNFSLFPDFFGPCQSKASLGRGLFRGGGTTKRTIPPSKIVRKHARGPKISLGTLWDLYKHVWRCFEHFQKFRFFHPLQKKKFTPPFLAFLVHFGRILD